MSLGVLDFNLVLDLVSRLVSAQHLVGSVGGDVGACLVAPGLLYSSPWSALGSLVLLLYPCYIAGSQRKG